MKQAAFLLIQSPTLKEPTRVKATLSDAWLSCTLRKETPSCLWSPNGFKMKLTFFFLIPWLLLLRKPTSQNRKSCFQNVKRCHLCYFSISSPRIHSFSPTELQAFKVRTTVDISTDPSQLLLCSSHSWGSVLLLRAIILSENYANHILIGHIIEVKYIYVKNFYLN